MEKAKTKIEELRGKTYDETIHCLKTYGKCCMIRPTGFGKTGILTRMISDKDNGYSNVLYLYPADIIKSAVLHFYYFCYRKKAPKDKTIPGVRFISYMKLVRMRKPDFEELGPVDLIIADECHKLGGADTMIATQKLLDFFPKAHFVGATATPDRMDNIDEVGRFFDDRVISLYTLHDAFQDGVLKKPHYVYNVYRDELPEVEAEKQEAKEELEQTYGHEKAKDVLRDLDQRLIETAELYNMDNVIRRTCKAYAGGTDYLKFIVFFFSYEALADKGEEVKEWFHNAFPDYIVTTTVITAENAETRANLDKLGCMVPRKNHIDLIYSCDMLNMGYHVDDLTGIVMYRGTKSDIIYTQQLGRVLSSAADAKAGIVIDAVDNIHQQAAYLTLGRDDIYTQDARKRKEELEEQKSEASAYAAYQAGTLTKKDMDPDMRARFQAYDEGSAPAPEWSKYDQSELNAVIRRFEGGGRETGSASAGAGCGMTQEDLDSVDLYAEEKVATYKELIRKTVAEARSIRCRKAWAHWTEEGGKTKDENGRILTRREVLAQKAPEEVPLPPFCFSKQVSVKAVLDEMHIPE